MAAPGCYNPSVKSGGLTCATTGKSCPDGFQCSNGKCVVSGAGGSGGGGTGGSCANAITPLCPSATDGLSGCDPVCQTGCPCGMRCAITSTGIRCTPPNGAADIDDVCQVDADDCKPGLACLKEACGTNLGRCYRLCSDGTMCGDVGVCGTLVNVPGGPMLRACNLGDYNCDPVSGGGCLDDALVCYLTSPNHTACDCPSGVNKRAGDPCLGYSDCMTGLACLGGVDGTSRCYKLCNTVADCPTCTALGDVGHHYCP